MAVKTAGPNRPTRSRAEPPLTMAEAALALGASEAFVLGLALSGAAPPADPGGPVVEIDYDVVGTELVFPRAGIARFLRRCPVGDLVPVARAAVELGVHRSRVSDLVYTGIQSAAGPMVRLPVWQIGGGEYVTRAALNGFAGHLRAAAARRAARETARKDPPCGRKPSPK